jgi:hypothetical protein
MTTSPRRPDELDPEERAWLSYISPHYARSDLGPEAPSAELKVLVFADRVWG